MVMKVTVTHPRILMVTLLVASIGGTFAIIDAFDLTLNPSDNVSQTGLLLTGNVKVTQFDEAGNIIAFRQTGNHIVAHGMEIIMGQVFNGVNESYPDTTVRPVSHMQIGTGGENVYATALRWNDTDIATAIPGCNRNVATIDNVTQGPSHKFPPTCAPATACSAQMNVTATASFTGAPCAVASIDEAGIFNEQALGAGLMFARNTFGEVTLMPMDTLQLDWEFTFTDD